MTTEEIYRLFTRYFPQADEDHNYILQRVHQSGWNDDQRIKLFLQFLAAALQGGGHASLSKTALRRLPGLLDRVILLFNHSEYLSNLLVTNPALYSYLIQLLLDPEFRPQLPDWNKASPGRFGIRLNGLKRYRQQEILRIGIYDMEGKADYDTVIRDLSTLADLILTRSMALAEESTCRRFELAEPPEVALFALGKLGGRELNYSSDIDLMAISGDQTHPDHTGYLLKKLTDFLTDRDVNGFLYRVDFRLRPDGVGSPLVRGLSRTLEYYQQSGRPWEAQMLLKSRFICGNEPLGIRFTRSIKGFVFHRFPPGLWREAIRDMKNRIEQRLPVNTRNIKLMRGGIRTIEFLTQGISLTHYQILGSELAHNTSETINRIRQANLFPGHEDDFADLDQIYRFYRSVEHHLQLDHNLPSEELPVFMDKLQQLTRSINADSPEQLLKQVQQYSERVQALFEQFCDNGLSDRPETGSRDPDTTTAIPLSELSEFNLKPRLLDKILRFNHTHYPDQPDSTPLTRLLRELLLHSRMDTLNRRHQLLDRLLGLMVNSRFAPLLITRLAESTWLRDELMTMLLDYQLIYRQIVHQPAYLYHLFFHGFLDDPRVPADRVLAYDAEPDSDGADQDAFLNYLRLHQIRYSWLFLDGSLDVNSYQDAITGLADQWLQDISEPLLKDQPLLILALGSYGRRQLRWSSDLDLLLITATDQPMDPILLQRWQSLAEGAFPVDYKLRPEGQAAPLVASLDYFQRYLQKRLSGWEQLALFHHRLIRGDHSLYQQFISLLHRQPVLTQADLNRIIQTYVNGHQKPGFLSLKWGKGGLQTAIDLHTYLSMTQKYSDEIAELVEYITDLQYILNQMQLRLDTRSERFSLSGPLDTSIQRSFDPARLLRRAQTTMQHIQDIFHKIMNN